MTIDPSTFLKHRASIPSPCGPAESEVNLPDGVVTLTVTVYPSPGRTSEIEVMDERRAGGHGGYFSAGVDADGYLVAVEGTAHMDSWQAGGCPLPWQLEEHREVLVPAIELAAEAAHLVADAKKPGRPKTGQRVRVPLGELPVRLHASGQTAADDAAAFLNTL